MLLLCIYFWYWCDIVVIFRVHLYRKENPELTFTQCESVVLYCLVCIWGFSHFLFSRCLFSYSNFYIYFHHRYTKNCMYDEQFNIENWTSLAIETVPFEQHTQIYERTERPIPYFSRSEKCFLIFESLTQLFCIYRRSQSQ